MFVDIDNKISVNNNIDVSADFGYEKYSKKINDLDDVYPKPLFILNKNECNLYYTRYELLQDNPVITNLNYSNLTSNDSVKLYNELDSKVMDFIQNTQNYPDSLFVGGD
jgi:hypothetical protein